MRGPLCRLVPAGIGEFGGVYCDISNIPLRSSAAASKIRYGAGQACAQSCPVPPIPVVPAMHSKQVAGLPAIPIHVRLTNVVSLTDSAEDTIEGLNERDWNLRRAFAALMNV